MTATAAATVIPALPARHHALDPPAAPDHGPGSFAAHLETPHRPPSRAPVDRDEPAVPRADPGSRVVSLPVRPAEALHPTIAAASPNPGRPAAAVIQHPTAAPRTAAPAVSDAAAAPIDGPALPSPAAPAGPARTQLAVALGLGASAATIPPQGTQAALLPGTGDTPAAPATEDATEPSGSADAPSPAVVLLAVATQRPGNGGPADGPLAAGPAVANGAGAAGRPGAGTVLAPGLATTATGDAPAASDGPAEPPAPPAPPPAAAPAIQVSALLRAVGPSAAQSFSIQLRPERLGSVDIRLDIDAKGHASASFLADHPETLQLLQHDMHHLVRALNQAGVDADAASLSFGLKDGGDGRSAGSGRQGDPARAARSAGTVSADDATRPVAAATAGTRLYDLHA